MGTSPQYPGFLPSASAVVTTFIDEEVKGALGGLPVAERNTNYFAVFKQVGGTGPEIIGQTAYFITYLVDENGNVSKPADDEISLNNLIQSFPTNGNCIVRQDAASALNSILAGKQKVAAIGRQQPILYSQTGYGTGSFSTAISFSIQNSSPGSEYGELLDYRGNMSRTSQYNLTTANYITNYTTVTQTPDAGAGVFNTSNGTYTLTPDVDLTSVTFRISFEVINPSFNPRSLKLGLYVDNAGAYSKLTDYEQIVDPGGVQSNFSYTATGFTLQNGGNDPKFIIRNEVADNFLYLEWINFQIQLQNPAPFSDAGSGGDFWTTGSAPVYGQWLTASAFLSQNYGNIQDSTFIRNQAASGYNLSPIISPFKVQIGDRIRFEYNKQKEYYIYDVIEPDKDPQNLLRLRINDFVPNATELNNFILHRTDITDPAYIILDIDKDNEAGDTQDFNGILFPEFPSKKLKDNIDTILIDLKEKGIITDNQS